jgi:adenylate cyclase
MDAARVKSITKWVTQAGLAGMAEPELLREFCIRLVDAGLPVARVNMNVDTLHPVYEGRVFRWRHNHAEIDPVSEYGRTSVGGREEEIWRRSPYYHLYRTGTDVLRRRIVPDSSADFPILDDLRPEGYTDYVALIHRFATEGAIGEMDCIYSSWATDVSTGFTDDQLSVLVDLVPSLALAVKCASLAQVAETLVETYLGRDAGRLVLSGRIARGVAERIQAVLWYSDLKGFTHTSETTPPEQIVPLLNDYAGRLFHPSMTPVEMFSS